jgi:RimJ/RimL family protein N-acetyltransferase
MEQTILFETDRLRLRQVNQCDSAFIYELLNMPKWIKYIGDRNIKTLDDASVYIKEKFTQNYERTGFGFYIMEEKNSQNPIGICGFVKRDYLDDVDFGFALLSRYEGKGFTCEASHATLEYGYEVLKFKSLLAITSKDNAASQGLLKKLGFIPKGMVTEPDTKEELNLFEKMKPGF